MRSRALLNVALLVVAVGLGLLLVLEPGRPVPEATQRLTALDAGAITQVRIEIPDGEPVEIAQRGEAWRLRAPLQLPANPFRVEMLTRAAEAVSHARYRVAEEDLPRFGLAPPRATLYLDDTALAFGATEPLSGRRYVRVGGEIHLVDDRFLARLTSPPASFVHPGPLGPDPEPLELTLPDAHLTLAEGGWRLVPEDPGVSRDALAALVDAWRYAQALSVRALDPDLHADATVRVRLRDRSEPVRFHVARDEERVILTRPDAGVQYHFTPTTGERLLSLSEHLPDAEDDEARTAPAAAE
ncbi:MAG: DUF4340 domain-containing protein [Gammaproteobacteria bacterium]|nr:DUF4340 domain-containing protein [Gammaproteobacteria bacterium]NIR82736.1 DUF4340 domain-containing protein [Gammaproteobacteria bacterium]NIR89600.1 DUF4340 domain-containing protein [Gammaproteobacteria bacterium]NIU03896.1 DUF4340 domain-containing protein [Gammaproteobacteria bacterium]NIV51212.1 DUF4340 domain-containing protein [Gammaproteobacteria bacterium]